MQEDTNVDNGRVNSAVSIADCQAACLSVPGCDGLDWNPADPVGRQCWLSGTWSGRKNVGHVPGIVHYDLVKSCGGTQPAARKLTWSFMPLTVIHIIISFPSPTLSLLFQT